MSNNNYNLDYCNYDRQMKAGVPRLGVSSMSILQYSSTTRPLPEVPRPREVRDLDPTSTPDRPDLRPTSADLPNFVNFSTNFGDFRVDPGISPRQVS